MLIATFRCAEPTSGAFGDEGCVVARRRRRRRKRLPQDAFRSGGMVLVGPRLSHKTGGPGSSEAIVRALAAGAARLAWLIGHTSGTYGLVFYYVHWILIVVAYAAPAQTLDLPKTVRQGGTLRIHGTAAALSARMVDRTIRLFPQTAGGYWA